MKIKVETQSDLFKIKNYTIRNIKDVFDDEGKVVSVRHFQAIVEDARPKNNRPLHCMLTYSSSDGEFLGFDERHIFSVPKRTEIPISMPVTVPENAFEATFKIDEIPQKQDHDLLIVFGFSFLIAAILLLIKYLTGK